MTIDLRFMMPQSKHDTEQAEAIIALGYPAVMSILPHILTWLQDLNWPVARTFAPFLVSLGDIIAPEVRVAFATDDDIWKSCILTAVVAHSPSLAVVLKPELTCFAVNPTPGEFAEDVHDHARDILATLLQ